MTLNGLLMAILRQIFTITSSFFEIILHTCCSLFTHVTSGNVRKRTVIRSIFGVRGKLWIVFRRNTVGTLTNKAINISI